MKSYFAVSVLVLGIIAGSLDAQAAPRRGPGFGGGMGQGMGPSPRFTKAMEKIFGENSSYSAVMEIEQPGMKMPGKLAFDQGKSRFEMDLSEAKGGGMGADTAAQMKAMGMDKMIAISRPDKKVSYVIYPGLKAYAEMPVEDQKEKDGSKPEDFKVKITELGKEKVDGHSTTKNNVVVSDDKETQYEAIVWNATDLKNFPVKIEQNQEGQKITMLFKDIKLGKQEASQFEPPTDFKKYASMQEMMQQEMMKRMGMPSGMPAMPRN